MDKLCPPVISRLLCSMVAILLLSFLPAVGWGQTSKTFTKSESFTVPEGVTSITVECWGAGGGGGNTSGATSAGGGGGGAYTKGIFTVVSGATVKITVGAGGEPGNAGGNTSVSCNGITLTANGGSAASGKNGGVGGLMLNTNPGVTSFTSYAGGNGGRDGVNGSNKSSTGYGGGGGGGGSAFPTTSGGYGYDGDDAYRSFGYYTDGAGGSGGSGSGSGGSGSDGEGDDAGSGNAPGGGGGGRGGNAGKSGSGADGNVVITIPPGALTNPSSVNFGYTAVNTYSGVQVVTYFGNYLTPSSSGTISIAAPPSNFETSLDNVTWSTSSKTISYTGGSLTANLYVRFKPTAANANYSGTITVSGGGTSPQTIAVSGNSIPPTLPLYSYKSGSWSDPTTWTLDPSGTTQVGSAIPASNDYVVILSNRNVYLPSDIATVNLKVTINDGGILDIRTYRFASGLNTLAGDGEIRIASAYFPAAANNPFVLAGGGTTEYYNASNFTLPSSQQVFNNLNINTPSGVVATQQSNLTLNGSLTLLGGTFRINDDASTAKLNLTINGDVTVNSGTSMVVGKGSTNSYTDPTSAALTGGAAPFLNYYEQFHRVVLYGNFYNYGGTVKFTNLALPGYASFPPIGSGATSGAATVYFMGGTSSSLVCSGTTNFYNLVVDKVDPSVSLTIDPSLPKNFVLYGANNAAYEVGADAANPNIKKAFWMRTGTVILKGATAIPSLSEGTTANSDYFIPLKASLVLNGPDVIVLSTADDYSEVNIANGIGATSNASLGISNNNANGSLGLLGNLIVNDGYLSTRESSGITYWSNGSGQLIINGGKVDAKQLLDGSGANSGILNYTQNGGTLYLRGRLQHKLQTSKVDDLTLTDLNTVRATNGIGTGAATFTINSNTSSGFSMGGGEIRIYDGCATGNVGAFTVACPVANISVTGGTLTMVPTAGSSLADATTLDVSTAAPLANFNVNLASGSTNVRLINSNLYVLKNVNLTAGTLDANGKDLYIGGNYTIASGSTYMPNSNRTVFNGSGNQTFLVNTAGALSLYRMKVLKTAPTSELAFAGSQKVINVSDSLSIITGKLNDNGTTINASGGVYNSGTHYGTGRIVLNGAAAQGIDGNGSGVFGNLELNNTTASTTAPISTTASFTINGVLWFTSDKSLTIGSNGLVMSSTASFSGAGTGSNRYIVTNGQAGDGGLTIAYSSSSLSKTFYVGAASTKRTTASYTPATIGFSSTPSSIGSVTVIPVGYEHPATTAKGKSLAYFWKVKSSGFPTSTTGVTHRFTYVDDDAQGSDSNYLPAYYNRTTYSWIAGAAASVNKASNVISDWTTSGTLLDGDYTAGNGAFGTAKKFYSCINGSSSGSGLWSESSNWSFTGNAGPPNTKGAVPGLNDIVIIGGADSLYLATDNTDIDIDVQSCASLQIEKGSALDIGYNPGCNFAMVLSHPNGNGNFRLTTSYNSGSTYTFPSGDFSEFNKNLGTTELYTTNSNSNTTYWLPNGVGSYGNLIISPLGGSNVIFPNNNLLIYGDLVIRGQNPDSWFCPTWKSSYPSFPSSTISKTITINGNMTIVGGSFGWYGNGSGGAQDVVVNGNVTVSANGGIDVWSGNSSQSFSIGGSLVNNTTGRVYSDQSTNYVNLSQVNVSFFGNSNSEIRNTSGTPITKFGKVTVSKGASQSTTLTCNIGGTLTTPIDNWLTLQNGTFIYKSPNDLNISTVTPFNIPNTASLDINTLNSIYIAQGNVSMNTVSLGGKLLVENGTVNVGNASNTSVSNSIEYASGGYSEISISGGTLNVNGQIRRNPLNAAGVLGYTQTGGTVNLYGNKASGGANATLEVVNDGSWFNMSGTSAINIINGGGGTNTFGDLYLRPASSSVTGGTITFGNTTAETFAMDASIPLNNLVINGTGGTNMLNLMVNPLLLNGSLTLSNATSVLKSNNVNVSLKGDFINNGAVGSYLYGTNTTTFNGNIQNIKGTSSTNFYNLNINPITSVTLNRSFTANGDLTISSGTLACGANKITLFGDILNNGTYTDNSGGVVLNGSTAQQQIGGTGTFGTLELNNVYGAKLLNSVSFISSLYMTAGILDINRYLLSLGQNSGIIANGAGFSASKMIASDGVYSDVGIKKVVGTGASSFTFPIGSGGKYTPAVLTVTSNGYVGAVRVNNINARHPSVLDPNNALRYYWEIESAGLSGFSGGLAFSYNQSDVVGDEGKYEASRLSIPDYNWSKSLPPTDNVDEGSNVISFTFPSNSTTISGEYTAGGDAALPAVIATYTSIRDGNWSDKTIWSPIAPDGGPNGYIVVIDKNTTVTASSNNTFAYRTQINSGGTLKVDPSTSGHNLGTVVGNGTLHLESGQMPAGRYDSFFDCSSSSTLEYGGSGDYTIVSDLYTSVPNLVVSGTGTRYYPNKDLTVCKKLNIDGPILDNSLYDRKLTILGSMLLTSGGFRSGTGDDARVVFSGTAKQAISTDANAFTGLNKFNSIEINNPSGLDLTGKMELGGNLYLTNGVINTSSTNTFTITNLSESCIYPSAGTELSYINGPLTKYMKTGSYDFVFPIGQNRYGYQIALKATFSNSVPWTVQYFNNNPTSTSFNTPISVVNSDEYWSVSSTDASSKGYVRLYWNSSSGLTPAMTTNGLPDMRIADLESGKWTALATSASGDNTNGSVTNASSYAFSSANTAYSFTTASVTGIMPKAKFSPTGAICGSSSIPVTIFTNGMAIAPPYILTYSLNGKIQSVTFSNLTGYSLPVSVAGNYQLVNFSYNNGSGVVDAKTVVTSYDSPTAAAAGPDLSLCGATLATLAGNVPTVGKGLWSIVSGTGGTVTSPDLYNSTLTGTNGSSYTARWTISNGGCISSDDVNINFTLKPNAPAAASPQAFCSGANLSNIATTVGTGTSINWYTVAAGGTVLSSATPLSNTTYYAEASNGCLSDSRTPVQVAITPNVSVTPIVSVGAEPSCMLSSESSTTYTSTVSNATSYLWSINNGSLGSINSLTGEVTWNPTVTGAANITIQASGCGPVATASRTVTVNSLPAPEFKTIAPACAGQGVSLSLTAAYSTYLWSVTTTGYSLSSTTSANPTLYAPSNDTLFPPSSSSMVSYPDVKVFVTDSNGCSNSVQNSSSDKSLVINRIPRTGPPYHVGNSVAK
ncbi:glycine-rich domain-containing protein [uncultured Acetobacteroides sp.]|uniref:glycine-rich domain-containing protein n=1 Tax=uncultured Acetobacteroides sp. TaxID=1760811 RepID=UPI0029F45BE4|nr:hypothetical protein [uncultured Acetobacteroides sp.]